MSSIDITEPAAQYILEFLTKNNLLQPVRLMLRKTGGCGDLSPSFAFGAGMIPDEDIAVRKFGLYLLCNLAKFPELDGVTVDLLVDDTKMSKTLKLESASLQACGCGKALTPKKS